MSESEQPRPRGSGSRVVFYVIVLVLVGMVVAGAMYAEPITYFVRLRTWDSAAPGRTVVQFLQAGKEGRREDAEALVGTQMFQPLEEGGRWVGFFMVTQAGRLEYVLADLLPAGEPKPTTEFIYRGNGAAEVDLPDKNGKVVRYRLEMAPSGWKITEIRGGRPG
jgi:hypothetical protein